MSADNAVSADNSVRIVVTGHDPNGEGIVVRDERVGPHGQKAVGYRACIVWGADETPSYPDDGLQAKWVEPAPEVGGFRWMVFLVPPDGQDAPPAGDGQVESDTPVRGMHESPGRPQFHFTATVDMGVVLDGEVWIELDGGREIHLRRGDCYVQQGTRHEWHNRTNEMARVAIAVIGAHHAWARAGSSR